MSLELLLATGIGLLTAGGLWLLLRARTFDVILGLTLLSYAVNLFLFAVGRLNPGHTPLLKEGVAPLLANHTDPLPQALVLTAIVISMAMTALLLVMAMRGQALNGSDQVDGQEPRA
jgi:multicomponent K+:H+ antiporter subunit C